MESLHTASGQSGERKGITLSTVPEQIPVAVTFSDRTIRVRPPFGLLRTLDGRNLVVYASNTSRRGTRQLVAPARRT